VIGAQLVDEVAVQLHPDGAVTFTVSNPPYMLEKPEAGLIVYEHAPPAAL
jgi:hypothetical protein